MVVVVLAFLVLLYLNSLVFWLDDVHRCKILLKIKKKCIQLFAQSQAEIMRKQVKHEDHGVCYQFLFKHGISHVRPVAKRETNSPSERHISRVVSRDF